MQHTEVLVTGMLVSATIVAGAILCSVNVSADDTATDNVSVSVPEACTIYGTGMNSHNASIPNGTYQADIGTTTLKAFCNDSSGFAIYAIGFSNEEYGNTNLTGAGAGQTIATGTATSGNTSNWAMKLATDSTATFPLTIDNSFGSYSAVPTSYTKVAHRDSGTDTGSSATGASLTSTYAAYISKTQSADTYNGKVKYTLIHPANEVPPHEVACEARRICYNANTNIVEGEMGKENTYNNAEVILWAPNFKRNGYGFVGWNDKYDYSGNYYGPNQTITVPSDVSTNGLPLYAVWIKSTGSLQNWNGCDSLAQGATTALTDERDGNTYAVAKLADNKCWMIENLRLADKDSNYNDINLSSTNTHNPSLPLNNSWYYMNQQDTLTTSNHLSTTSDPTSTNPDTAWCMTNSSDCYDQSMLATNNTTFFTNNTTSSYDAESDVYSYGNYYNWYSATAGHGKYGSSYGSSYTAPGDICPAGWHLPTGKDATGDFGVLDIAIGGTGADQSTTEASNRWRAYPNNFVYSGNVPGSSINDRNSYGYYWSSSASNDIGAYLLRFGIFSVYPGAHGFTKYSGRVVRCVAGV